MNVKEHIFITDGYFSFCLFLRISGLWCTLFCSGGRQEGGQGDEKEPVNQLSCPASLQMVSNVFFCEVR